MATARNAGQSRAACIPGSKERLRSLPGQVLYMLLSGTVFVIRAVTVIVMTGNNETFCVRYRCNSQNCLWQHKNVISAFGRLTLTSYHYSVTAIFHCSASSLLYGSVLGSERPADLSTLFISSQIYEAMSWSL